MSNPSHVPRSLLHRLGVAGLAGLRAFAGTGASKTVAGKTPLIFFRDEHTGRYVYSRAALGVLVASVAVVVSLAVVVAPALALKPGVVLGSESVSEVKSAEATFAATLNPNNEETSYAFEYATSEVVLLAGTGMEVKEPGELPLEGLGEQPVAVPTGLVLAPSTTYYYRVRASNATGVSYGPMQSFATVSTPFTDAATSPVGMTSAALNGHLALNPDFASQYHFEYTLGSACAGESSTPTGEAGKGSGTAVETAAVTGLQPNAEYTVCFVHVECLWL